MLPFAVFIPISFLLIGSALYIQGQPYIFSASRWLFLQAALVALIAFAFAIAESSWSLVVLGILIVLLRGVGTMHFLQRSMHMKRRIVAREPIRGTAGLLVINMLFLVAVFIIFTISLPIYLPQITSLVIFPIGLFFEGLFLIASRKNTFMHIIGYVEEENAVVLLGILIIPISLVIEASVLLDVLAIVVISSIVAKEKFEHMKVDELVG